MVIPTVNKKNYLYYWRNTSLTQTQTTVMGSTQENIQDGREREGRAIEIVKERERERERGIDRDKERGEKETKR